MGRKSSQGGWKPLCYHDASARGRFSVLRSDLDGGRFALRALRAHRRGDRKWAENPHKEAGSLFATMTRPHGGVSPCSDRISTEDDSLSAHFEHTVAVTENGPKILTRRLEASLLP